MYIVVDVPAAMVDNFVCSGVTRPWTSWKFDISITFKSSPRALYISILYIRKFDLSTHVTVFEYCQELLSGTD